MAAQPIALIPHTHRPMPYILLLGDSLTELGYTSNWVSRLSNYYIRRAEIVNRGLSGYNSRWVLEILNDPARRHLLIPEYVGSPLFVTLLLGSNDYCDPPYGVPLDEFRSNMKKIISIVREHANPQTSIFLMTPPPVDKMSGLKLDEPTTEKAYTRLSSCREYRNTVLEIVAEDKDVISVDLFKKFLGADVDAPYSRGEWVNLFYDGLHFNDAGGEVVFNELKDALIQCKFTDQLNPENMPYSLPPHEYHCLQ